MQNRGSSKKRPSRVIASIAGLGALMLASSPAYAERVRPPYVPVDIEVMDGHKPYLVGHAVGTQNYICLPAAQGIAWTLFGPQATLFDDGVKQLTTHFLSPNPAESGTLRATWQHSRDTSSVWAMAIASSSDANFVSPDTIPWLLLRVVGTDYGPGGGRKLTRTTYIQRVNTAGGLMPATDCSESTDIGKRVFVPYTADYYFYREMGADEPPF